MTDAETDDPIRAITIIAAAAKDLEERARLLADAPKRTKRCGLCLERGHNRRRCDRFPWWRDV